MKEIEKFVRLPCEIIRISCSSWFLILPLSFFSPSFSIFSPFSFSLSSFLFSLSLFRVCSPSIMLGQAWGDGVWLEWLGGRDGRVWGFDFWGLGFDHLGNTTKWSPLVHMGQHIVYVFICLLPFNRKSFRVQI